MSLKIEQILIDHQFAKREPRIFAEGVHLVPIEICVKGEIKYVWVADEFSADTYFNGKLIVPNVISEKLENLYRND